MKIVKIESCFNCPYRRVLYCSPNASIYHCERKISNEDAIIEDKDIIPSWCPLEDLKV